MDGFYDARTARQIAFGGGSGNLLIINEINALRVAIATAAAAGNLTITIVGTTTMTSYDNYNGSNTSSYYDAFAGLNVTMDTVKKSRDAMNVVMAYFVKLGYTITRARDGNNNRMSWVIYW